MIHKIINTINTIKAKGNKDISNFVLITPLTISLISVRHLYQIILFLQALSV